MIVTSVTTNLCFSYPPRLFNGVPWGKRRTVGLERYTDRLFIRIIKYDRHHQYSTMKKHLLPDFL